MPKPSPSTYVSYFKRYIDQVAEEDLMTAFKNQTAGLETFLNSINEEKSNYAYAEDKWTIKELLQHIIDTEHIFNYRALCLARGEMQNLPGFEEDDYAANSYANNRQWAELVQEFLMLRKSTEMMYTSFNKAVIDNAGKANNNPVTVNSLGFTTVGHYYHHKKVLEERYL
jgi:arsenate reductase-like glutaredoxin family protein